MIHVISDLHGYPLEKFKMLLKKFRFCDDDELFILGDVVDRNGDGEFEPVFLRLDDMKEFRN